MFQISTRVLCSIVLGCALLAGCSSTGSVTASDIAGVWVETPAPGGGVDCAIFEFRGDGTFTARNLPREHLVPEAVPGLPRVQAAGTWTMQDTRGTQYVDILIDVNLEWLYNSARHSTLYISGDEAERTLYAWAHDEDSRITFVKRDTAEC